MIPKFFALFTMPVLVGMVIVRVRLLKNQGIKAMNFGKTDKTDFLIPPFVLYYFYLIVARAFNLPFVNGQEIIHINFLPWIGVLLLVSGIILMAFTLVSFGKSFRVGIDEDHPDKLITTGVFAYTRNPIYVAFISVFAGQFLIFPSSIMLAYLIGAGWLINRQILREEDFLKAHYGKEFIEYCGRVRRYV